MANRPPTCPVCPVCQNCSLMVESAVGDAKATKDASDAALKKTADIAAKSAAANTLLNKQVLAKSNELAKAKTKIAKLEAELKQLKVDLNKLIGMWEPPPSTGEHIVLTLGDEKKEEEE